MMRLWTLLLAVGSGLCMRCAPGYDPFYDGVCLQLKGTEKALSSSAARLLCSADLALPVKITTKEEETMLLKAIARKTGGIVPPFWIACQCDPATNTTVYSTGAANFSYSNIAEDFDCSSRKQATFFFHNGSKWIPSYGNETRVHFVACQQFALAGSECGDYLSGTVACDSPVRPPATWSVANHSCAQEYAVLATDWSDILEFASPQEITAARGGIHINVFTPEWSNYTSDKFAPGFPDAANHGECVAQHTEGDYAGMWMNVPCDGVQLPYSCRREKYVPDSLVSTECERKMYREGDVVLSPGFPSSTPSASSNTNSSSPSNSSTPSNCTSLVSVEKRKVVALVVEVFELNVCCDTVVLRDGFFGENVIAELTGSLPRYAVFHSSSNGMRIEWRAGSGRGVKGFKFFVHAVDEYTPFDQTDEHHIYY